MTWLPALLGRRSHLCDPRGLHASMERSFGSPTFEQRAVRCAVVARAVDRRSARG